MKTRVAFLPILISIFLLAGCRGTGEMVNLRIYDLPSDKEKVGENLLVAVEPFEDSRADKTQLGMRTHMGGGFTYYNLMGGNLETGAAESFIAFLNSRGFQASKAGSSTPDVTIKAIIIKFTADATSSFMNTHLESHAITQFHVTNHADNSKVRLTIGSGGTDDELIFNQEDMEDLVNTALQEGFEEFLENITMQGKTLRKKV